MTALGARVDLAGGRQVQLAAAVLTSVLLGASLAVSDGSVPVAVILLIAIGAVVTCIVSVELALAALIVTCPIGLEQLTGGDRPLLQSFGGWAVSSVRLGVLLLLGLTVLAIRGLPRRLVFEEYVYLGLVGWFSATLLFSPDPFAGIRFTAKLAVVLVAWLAFGWLVRRRGERFMWRLLMGTLAGALVVAYVLIALGLNFVVNPDGTKRFAALADPSSGPVCLAALALPALYLWFRDRRPIGLLLYFMAWVPVLLSVTRIAILGFVIASLVLAAVMRRWVEAAAIGLIVGVAAFSYAPLRERMAFGSDSQSWQTIAATVQNQGVGGLNTQGRTELWSFLSQQYHAHPIAGSGVGASEAVLQSSSSFGGLSQAHSDYMAVLVNGGLIALGLWLVAFGGLMVRFFRLRGPAAPAAAVVSLYLVVAITDNAVEMYAYLGIPLAAFVAIALEADRRRRASVGLARRGDRPSVVGERRYAPQLS